ncbi:L-galactose dehydrogenase [Seminavis robusta]|uniref:L-galactose dehydrogenase n=1 Tax=Seminavis robusta TaxID=568900 RepID=A0A9N8DN35_9STRA|nr:L-galactose dehydrogenase [Seminavis robusta]|eukprot:Sro171_g075690.1 L-galactose dehydrogenase (435) ;mRNA; f:18211-19515
MTSSAKSVPRRPYGSKFKNSRLPSDLPIIGLGCSSFSTFFWTEQEQKEMMISSSSSDWTPEGMDRSHPQVQEWIATIRYAVEECGITLLDTAPWYGHGTSEVIIGWAMEEMLSTITSSDNDKKDTTTKAIQRSDLVINTKVGRYEADPQKQFDFSKQATLQSVERSIRRMNCGYIDVLQLHDSEFAPSLDVLLQETIPAMIECRTKGYCKALGMTGYPLQTQFQILQRTREVLGDDDVWDQSLTYGHYNLVNQSLFTKPLSSPDNNNQQYESFAAYCEQHSLGLMAAAPLNMGLLTNNPLPAWHPASDELKAACRTAAATMEEVDIATIAIVYALANPQVPCTVLGMKNVAQVATSQKLALRFRNQNENDNPKERLKQVLTPDEYKAWQAVMDPIHGPFATVWKNGTNVWDGVLEATKFWQQVEGQDQEEWHWE